MKTFIISLITLSLIMFCQCSEDSSVSWNIISNGGSYNAPTKYPLDQDGDITSGWYYYDISSEDIGKILLIHIAEAESGVCVKLYNPGGYMFHYSRIPETDFEFMYGMTSAGKIKIYIGPDEAEDAIKNSSNNSIKMKYFSHLYNGPKNVLFVFAVEYDLLHEIQPVGGFSCLNLLVYDTMTFSPSSSMKFNLLSIMSTSIEGNHIVGNAIPVTTPGTYLATIIAENSNTSSNQLNPGFLFYGNDPLIYSPAKSTFYLNIFDEWGGGSPTSFGYNFELDATVIFSNLSNFSSPYHTILDFPEYHEIPNGKMITSSCSVQKYSGSSSITF